MARNHWRRQRRFLTHANRTRAVLTVVAVGGLLSLSACGGSSANTVATTPPTTVRPSSPASPENAQVAAALSAYQAMWRDVVVASRTSDYQSATLADHASGQALSLITKIIYAQRKAGLVTKGAPLFEPRPTASSTPAQSEVTFHDCGDFSNWLNYRADTGKLEDATPGGKHRIMAQVEPQQGVWKVTKLSLGDSGTC